MPKNDQTRSENQTPGGFFLLESPNWKDYELLDSGEGQKLERFGRYVFVRPEAQAVWRKKLPLSRWLAAEAVFKPSGEESGGHWESGEYVPEQWEMRYPLIALKDGNLNDSDGSFRAGFKESHGTRTGDTNYPHSELRFSARTTPGRHVGVFPECAANWDWAVELIQVRRRAGLGAHSINPTEKVSPGSEGTGGVNVLNLFGYTGLASLACAAAGARVTHVDASRKSVSWARENQSLSGLAEKPIRWMVDDAQKFVEREARRGVRYDGILLDPPKFGRGPKGEVWEVFKHLPPLLQACRSVLNKDPLFVLLTVYAVKLPAVHARTALAEMMLGLEGCLECGELVTRESSAGRLLSQATFARWHR